MKILRLWTLLLVPIFSAQAFAQIDTLTVENDSADTEYMQEEDETASALPLENAQEGSLTRFDEKPKKRKTKQPKQKKKRQLKKKK